MLVLAWLVALGARQEQCQDAVVVFGLHAVGIDLDRQCHSAVESTRQALAPMHARFLRVVHRLRPGQPDRVAFHLHLEVRLLDAGKFGDDVEVKSSPLRNTFTGG
jgi:hypothetical protein